MATHARLRLVGGTEVDPPPPEPFERRQQLFNSPLAARFDLAFSTLRRTRRNQATWTDYAGRPQGVVEIWMGDLMDRLEAEFSKPQYSALAENCPSPRRSKGKRVGE
jgi:hypothetical protein